MISAGDLTRSITLLTTSSSRDAFGQPILTNSTVRTVRAARRSLRAADFARGQITSDVAEVKYEIRYAADVTTAMKVQEDGVTYSILSVDEVGNKESLILLCKVAQ